MGVLLRLLICKIQNNFSFTEAVIGVNLKKNTLEALDKCQLTLLQKINCEWVTVISSMLAYRRWAFLLLFIMHGLDQSKELKSGK